MAVLGGGGRFLMSEVPPYRKGLLAEDEIGRMHSTMTQELVASLRTEVDDDVKRFIPSLQYLLLRVSLMSAHLQGL